MPLKRIIIKNFKSIKYCDITLSELNVLIGENGTGKTNILSAIQYFYKNLVETNVSNDIFDENNRYSNEVFISLIYDFSDIVKISKSNSGLIIKIGEEVVEEKRYTGYYNKIVTMASKVSNNSICVELSQIKGHAIHWNYSYEERLIIKNLFPIFYVDTRNLDITQWEYVWDILGEIAKVSHLERKVISDEICDIILNSKHETSLKLKLIKEIFEASNVSIKPYTTKEYAINLTKVFFSGNSIRQSNRNLDFYSSGTNSIKYIEILLKAMDILSRTKMKEPIILFDEPEISLHSSYLDELAESLIDVNSKLNVLIATHSPRLTKNLLSESNRISLFKVKRENDKYTSIHQMKQFTYYSPKSKYRVLDDHINAYFSTVNLFVEGETELELFANPYLKILFPKLKKVDVFKAMSDMPILNVMSPELSNSKIPYLYLLDMDKVLSFDKSEKKLHIKTTNFARNTKESFRFWNKYGTNNHLSYQYKRLKAMESKLYIQYYSEILSCNDKYFYDFVKVLHQYLLSYNIFCLKTTIEGVLINKNTIDFSLEFLKNQTDEKLFEEFYAFWKKLNKNDRLNILRLLFNGKTDLLGVQKHIFGSFDDSIKLMLEKTVIGQKTSGWVSCYLDSFFGSIVTSQGSFTPKKFRRYLENKEDKQKVLDLFKYHFSELYALIDKLCDMVDEEQ